MPQAAKAMFELHPAFAATSDPLGDLALSHVRIQSDARWPWIVLIPRIEGARELEDLCAADRARLMDEIVLAGSAIRAAGLALDRPIAKLNVGQLGNLTPQLHVHVVGRRLDDVAWPGPVWGVGAAQAYEPVALSTAVDVMRKALAL